MWFITVELVLAVGALVYLFLTWNFSYWKKLGVNGPTPRIMFGNYPNLHNRHMAYNLDDFYKQYKKDEDFIGIYNGRMPQLLVTSPALARRIYVTDFKHFHDNEASQMVDESSDYMFANSLFALTGEQWREKRAELVPALTSGRVKGVYPKTNRICKRMTDYIKEQLILAPIDGLEGMDICLRFTSEVVTDCVLGLNADSFGKKPTPISGMISTILGTSFAFFFYAAFFGLFPIFKRFHKMRFIPKSTEKFFKNLIENGIDFCKSQQMQNPLQIRNQFLDYMLQLQENSKLSTLQLTAHSMTFMLEGLDTTATVIAHCLLMFGRHPLIQKKVYSEFKEYVTMSGAIDFDVLVKLPYLDACIHETIRIFPPAFFANKICTEPIELTNKNGRKVQIRKGEVITLPLYSFMMDDDYYSNPHEFRPERFLKKNGGVKKYRHNGVFFGFGDGPRKCIGKSFALAQTKAAIVQILRNFHIQINEKTRKDNIWNPKILKTQLEGGIWLDFKERNL